jgi:hypothetical protein
MLQGRAVGSVRGNQYAQAKPLSDACLAVEGLTEFQQLLNCRRERRYGGKTLPEVISGSDAYQSRMT